MEKKTGIFICKGCRIASSMDVDGLCKKMQDELKPAVCQSHKAYCSPAGIDALLDVARKESLDALLIAGCGKGTKDEVFRFEDQLTTERVNIREFVAWSMDGDKEDTLMAAEDYLRMGYAGIEKKAAVKPYLLSNVKEEILVIGGGVAGLSAALEGAGNGHNIHLLEKQEQLGGWSARWKSQIPFDQPFDQLREPVVTEMIRKVEENEKIHVYTGTEISAVQGQPGDFTVHLVPTTDAGGNGNPDAQNQKVIGIGSIVTAAGWKPYQTSNREFFGYGDLPGVATSTEFEQELAEGAYKPVNSVLFVQCAGSRDPQHLPYCSSVCCSISLKQAKQIRDTSPETIIYIVYKDIRTPGFLENFYKEMQDDPHIIFIKGEVTSVTGSGGKLRVEISDDLLGNDLVTESDRVVLATGMVPNNTEDLNLKYRLGKGLPELKYDFSDSHFICFPYETRRTGIYAAGALRAPMDIPSAIEDGAGAMMKAVQVIEATKRGEAVHPRSGDQSYPELYMERCTDCKRCTEECPFGTYDETDSGTPVVNPTRCRRCGICLGACPERVISFADYSINSISAMIKSIEVPDEFEEKPRVLVFVCENDALPALEMAAREKLNINPYVRIIPVRCLGSINRVWVSDALSKGYDGILQIGCKPGDDYQCHFIHGSELTEQRSEIYEETLSSMMLEPERIATRFVEINDYKQVIAHIDEYMEQLEFIGPNPFKDM